jgi:hypothetical protein
MIVDMTMIMKRLVLAGIMMVGCSSSSSTPGTNNGALQFGITLPSAEVVNFSCNAAASGPTIKNNAFEFNCASDASGSTLLASVSIPAFHGSDTYALTQDSTAGAPIIVQFQADNFAYAAAGVKPGYAATTCSTQVNAPAKPQKGDASSGKFHCDNAVGMIIDDDGGYHPLQLSSVDGTFNGAFTSTP